MILLRPPGTTYCPRRDDDTCPNPSTTDKTVEMPESDEIAPRVRIVSWNIHGAERPDLDDLARVLSDFDTDIIGLQEVRRHQAKRLSRILGMHCIWTFKHNGYSRLLPRFAEGLAIMSRWPLDHDGDIELSNSRQRSDFRRRVAMWATIDHPAGKFVVVNTHLASHDDSDDRRQQSTKLASLISDGFPCNHHGSHAPSTTVVTGDLNDHDEPTVVETITGALLKDAWAEAITRSRNGSTNPAAVPYQRLDHVLVPRWWTVHEVRVPDPSPEWETRSDHLPVLVETQMRSK
jgi:endonuclease/exonuclease/phosphatase family metal-dependent hydrolase